MLDDSTNNKVYLFATDYNNVNGDRSNYVCETCYNRIRI